MRRVLLFITDLEIGGTPGVVRELSRRLSRPGEIEVEAACIAPPGPVSEQMQQSGVAVHSLNISRPILLPLAVIKLTRLIRRRNIDTVISFLIHANTVATAAKLLNPHIDLIQSIRTTQAYPAWHWKLQRLIAPAARKIVVSSPSIVKAAQDRSGIHASQIVVIPNAIDPDAFAQPPKPMQYRIGYLGRLDPVKRIDDLLRALALLPSQYTLNIFGQGKERANLEKLADQLNQRVRVTFFGPVNDPREAFRQMDILVLPSESEGFGIVLLEAAAAGLPIVATQVAGIRDVVTHQQTALLVPPKSPAALKDAIQQACENATLREHLITEASRHVRQHFNWSKAVEAYVKLINA